MTKRTEDYIEDYSERLEGKIQELSWMKRQYGTTNGEIAVRASVGIVLGELEDMDINERDGGAPNPEKREFLRRKVDRMGGTEVWKSYSRRTRVR